MCLGLGIAGSPVVLLAHGALSELIAQQEQVCRAHPENAEAHFKLADRYLEHEEWEKTLPELDRTEQLAPGQFPTDYLRGSAFLLAEKPAEALAVLDRFVARYPENYLGLLQRARARRALGKIELSLQDFRAALRLARQPEPDLILEAANAVAATGAKPEALAILEQGLARLGSIPSLTLRALELEIATGRFDSAVARIDVFQNTAPRPEPWMARRAELLAQAGRIDDARGAWQALVAHLDALPNLERGSHAMSMVAEKARLALKALPVQSSTPPASPIGNANYDEELDRVDDEIERHPAEGKFRFQRAEFNRLAQRWDRARADCAEADRLAPGKFPTTRARGEILFDEGKLAEASEVLSDYVLHSPDDGMGWVARARVQSALGRFDLAVDAYRRGLARFSEASPELYQEIASALESHKRLDEAAKMLTAGLVVHPENPALTNQALDLEIVRGNIDPAVEFLSALIKNSPRPEPLMARRARLLAQAGRTVEARTAWRAIAERIAARPNLERGAPDLVRLAEEARQALATPLVPTPPLSSPVTLAHASPPPRSLP